MTAFKPIKEGKVREIYDNGNSLIMVATDRISAFDVILKNKVTKKGTVLTQMSKFWFDYTKDLLRHPAARGPAGVPEAAGAHLHPLHQGRDRRPRREHLLRAQH